MTTYQDSAAVNNGKLVLSFPNAVKPVVWQMDLVEARTSAFEMDETAKGEHTLSYTKAGAKTKTVIATFAAQDTALDALMMTSQALENVGTAAKGKTCGSHGQKSSHCGTGEQSGKKCGFLKCLLSIVIGLFLLFLLFMISASLRMQRVSSVGSAGVQTSQSAPMESGVPMSADAFLNGR